jgi:hypothetical protein
MFQSLPSIVPSHFAQAGVPLGRTKSQSAATSALLSNPTPRTGSLSDLATAAAARDPHHRDNGNNITFEDKSGARAFPITCIQVNPLTHEFQLAFPSHAQIKSAFSRSEQIEK